MDLNSLSASLINDHFGAERTCIDVTPEVRSLIDERDLGLRKLVGVADGTPFTPQHYMMLRLERDEWLTEWLGIMAKHPYGNSKRGEWHRKFADYDRGFISKYGPQGGRFTLSELKASYLPFYENAKKQRSFRIARRGRDYLIRRIRSRIELVGYPQPKPSAVCHTNGALPTHCKKGSFRAETTGRTWPRHVIPDYPGMRRQRNKNRVINQDACINVRYWEEELNGIRDWLKAYFPEYFSSWLNPEHYERPALARVFEHQGLISVELDYNHCDENFSLQLVQEIVLPILEVLFPDSMQFNYFTAYVEEMFHQPVYFGDELWCGLHNLFSGQVFTNDFETYYDVALQLGALLEVCPHLPVVHLARGDDQALVSTDWSMDTARKVMESLMEEADSNGMPVSVEKSELREGCVQFCKNMYYPGCRRYYTDAGDLAIMPAYPTILALNNCVNPERVSRTDAEFVRALLQRLDGCAGTVYYYPLLDFIGTRLQPLSHSVTCEEVELSPDHDWYERVFGAQFQLRKSLTYRYWLERRMLILS